MTKQEAIAKAYGEHWDKVKDHVDENGYIVLMDERSSLISWNEISMLVHPFDNHRYRPASLQGIDDNNGWVRIDSEADLPKESGMYWVMYNGEMDTLLYSRGMKKFDYDYAIERPKVTHYQPIVKPSPPIY